MICCERESTLTYIMEWTSDIFALKQANNVGRRIKTNKVRFLYNSFAVFTNTIHTIPYIYTYVYTIRKYTCLCTYMPTYCAHKTLVIESCVRKFWLGIVHLLIKVKLIKYPLNEVCKHHYGQFPSDNIFL